ncbi:MAG: phage tail assembly chaperone [Burkholderia gladioli]
MDSKQANSYTHDHMILAILDMYPKLQPGRDFLVSHPITPEGDQAGAPTISVWSNANLKPTDDEVHAHFEANEEALRAKYLRFYRDLFLSGTDGNADLPSDSPECIKGQCNAWRTYRQQLRDLPNQPGFPMSINWPEFPDS